MKQELQTGLCAVCFYTERLNAIGSKNRLKTCKKNTIFNAHTNSYITFTS
jgi:hypothetical protein